LLAFNTNFDHCTEWDKDIYVYMLIHSRERLLHYLPLNIHSLGNTGLTAELSIGGIVLESAQQQNKHKPKIVYISIMESGGQRNLYYQGGGLI